MENNLLEDVEFYEILNNNNQQYRAILFKNIYTGKNMLNDSIFKKWYKEENKKRNIKFRIDEDRNEILFCLQCHKYIYDTDRYLNQIKCCEDPSQKRICLYCGQLFYVESYCCLRNSIKYSFREYLLNGLYFCSCFGNHCIKSVPIVFRFYFVETIMKAFFLRRQREVDNIDTFLDKETTLSKLTLKIIFVLEIVYIFIFYIPLTFIYIIYLFFYFQISLNQFQKEY